MDKRLTDKQIEKLAENKFPFDNSIHNDLRFNNNLIRSGFIVGFKSCQELYNNKNNDWINIETRLPDEGKPFFASDGYVIEHRLTFMKGKSKIDFKYWRKTFDLPTK